MNNINTNSSNNNHWSIVPVRAMGVQAGAYTLLLLESGQRESSDLDVMCLTLSRFSFLQNKKNAYIVSGGMGTGWSSPYPSWGLWTPSTSWGPPHYSLHRPHTRPCALRPGHPTESPVLVLLGCSSSSGTSTRAA